MSPVLHFDIIAEIIDVVGKNGDTNLLKELALVSHSFLEICTKHLFATVDLHDADPIDPVASSKKGFIKLHKSRPDVVKYIRKLTYTIDDDINDDDHLLSPILLNFLPTISRLNHLTISSEASDWNELDSLVKSALLHLMHLPTINRITLSHIYSFPLSNLAPSVNLHRLDIFELSNYYPHEEEEDIQWGMMPRIREFRTIGSALETTKLIHAKRQDGQSAFNFMDLRRLSICLEDKQNIRYILQNAKLLEELHISPQSGYDFAGLHDILSPSARTLQVLDITVLIYSSREAPTLAGLCEELEAMAGHYMLEALSFMFVVCIVLDDTEDFIRTIIQNVEKVLANPGWSALRQVSFKVKCFRDLLSWNGTRLSEELQSLPNKYFSRLSKLESITLNYSVEVD